jgi:DNA-binding LacI/PurR family transcriptional regulator
LDVAVVNASAPTFEAASEAVTQLLKLKGTAVIAFNDQMALGVMAGLARRGVSVPEDVSVIGFDDVPMAAMVAPPLTTIGLPTEEAGSVAFGLLQDEGASSVELTGKLVIRSSTAPVSGR